MHIYMHIHIYIGIAAVNARKKSLKVETDPRIARKNIRSSVEYLVNSNNGKVRKPKLVGMYLYIYDYISMFIYTFIYRYVNDI
jgi:hypothetical protein